MAEGLSDIFVWVARSEFADAALTCLFLFGAALVFARTRFKQVS